MTRWKIAGLLGLVLLVAGCHRSAPAPKVPEGDALEGQSAAWFFERGKERQKAGDAVRAEQYFAAAMRRGYDEARVVPLLIDVCLDGQRLRSALNYAEPFLKKHPEELALRQLVATLHLALDQVPEARNQLEAMLRQEPTFAEGYYLLAVLSSDYDQDEDAARSHYQQYLVLAPNGRYRPEARSWLAEHVPSERRQSAAADEGAESTGGK